MSSLMASFNAAATGVRNGSSATKKAIAEAPPDQQKLLEAQAKMKEEENLMQLISNFLKHIATMSESAIRNMA